MFCMHQSFHCITFQTFKIIVCTNKLFASHMTPGPAAKLRRAQIREHPYQRAILDPRG